MNTILEAVRRFESHYPEILYRMYFINGMINCNTCQLQYITREAYFDVVGIMFVFLLAFRVFQLFFSLMKPLLSMRTLGKLEIYTTPNKWAPVLSSNIPADQLPIEFGGTQTGRRRVSIGNTLKLDKVDLEEAEIVIFDIPAEDSLKLELGNIEPNTVIE